MAKLYSIGITIAATAYIIADSAEEAMQKARDNLVDGELIVPQCRDSELPIDGGTYRPDMPEISLSPAMTLVGPEEDARPDEVEDFGEECGQCEGTGTTQSASNQEDEECPVCDGTGRTQ
jgi:hypothetical protein